MHRVGLMAQAFGIKFNPHFWGTGISFAAALHSLALQPIGQIDEDVLERFTKGDAIIVDTKVDSQPFF